MISSTGKLILSTYEKINMVKGSILQKMMILGEIVAGALWIRS